MARGIRKEKFYDSSMIDEMKEEVRKTITESSPAEVESNGPETKNGIVVNSLFVNVRREPSMKSDVVNVLRRGDSVQILDKTDGFYKINVGLIGIGYISSDFIREE